MNQLAKKTRTLRSPSVSLPPVAQKALMIGGALLAAACVPPTKVFFPDTGTVFQTDTAAIEIRGLTQSTAVCYTTDGSDPVWNGGACGTSSQRLAGPVSTAQITLNCGTYTGSSVRRSVKLAYDWQQKAGYTASAEYFLNCGDDDTGSGGGTDTGGDNGGDSDSDGISGRSTLLSGKQLVLDEYLQSSNGLYRLYMQTDGNLVLRDWTTRNALWSTSTHGTGAVRVKLQEDGNLVIRDAKGAAIWSSKTHGTGAQSLVLQDDGNLVLLAGSQPVWSTGTASGGGSGGGTGGGTSASVQHVGTTKVWDSNGQGISVARPAGTQAGDLLVLVLHRTDDVLPFNVAGWQRGAECYKEDNGYQCLTVADCTTVSGNFCDRFKNQYRGRDLAQAVFYKRAGSSEPGSYSFDLNKSSTGGHPGWAILTTLRGANTTAPIRAWAHRGCDNNADSLFPSVEGRKGDMLLLSQSFDDAISQSKFGAPSGMSTFGYVSNSDEAGFLFGGILTSDGPTGERKTQGDGASSCKDALVALTIKAQ